MAVGIYEMNMKELDIHSGIYNSFIGKLIK